MKLEEKLQQLRKAQGYSQEQLAEELHIARQTVGKWENGQAVPELDSLLMLSKLYGITLDRLVKEDDLCNEQLFDGRGGIASEEVISFLLRAKKHTYAAKGQEANPSRMASHDYRYGEKDYLYYDTYLGGECFAGEEAVWFQESPVWSMNYAGRVVGGHFSSDFLKEALLQVTEKLPFRGPELYIRGDYHYHCRVAGDFFWFQGYEDIFYGQRKIYECFFHGGRIR